MNENTLADQPGTAVPQPLHLLRQAREARGMHIAILSAALKVSVKKLEALEAGRFDELPGLTFARALASSACRQLKIDPTPILAQIPVAQSPRLGYAESSMDTPFKGTSETRSQPPVWRLSMPALLLALSLLVGAMLVVYWPASAPVSEASVAELPAVPVAPPVEAAEPAAVAEKSPAEPPAGVPAAAEPVASTALPGQAATVSPSLVPSGVAPVGAAAPTVEPMKTVSASGSLMSIRATSESWVEVSSASGAVLLKRLLKNGEVVDFTSPPPYTVLLGRVDAAEVTVRGQRFDATPFARNSVARFEVK